MTFPEISIGQEKMKEKKKQETDYFAFGSDDLTTDKRQEDNKLKETLTQGKQMFQKFGSFLGNSIKNIAKPKKEDEQKTRKNSQDETAENAPKVNEFKQISNKIGQSLMNFGVT